MYEIDASAALISVALPLSVSWLLLLAPLDILAPPVKLTPIIPWLALSSVLARFPETSVTLVPVMSNFVSSLVV